MEKSSTKPQSAADMPESLQSADTPLDTQSLTPTALQSYAADLDIPTDKHPPAANEVGVDPPAIAQIMTPMTVTEAKPDLPKPPKTPAPLLNQFVPEAINTVDPQPTAAAAPSLHNGQAQPIQNSEAEPALPMDPELGVLRVSSVRQDPELGIIQLRNPLQDSELGILRLRQFSPPPRPGPIAFLSAYVTASSSDNVFLVEDPVQGRLGDNVLRPGISITAFPAIGPDTNFLVSAGASLLRYNEQSDSNYNEASVQAGVRHRFTDRVYGQFIVSHQRLFEEGYRDQFFVNTGIEFSLRRRDAITPRLSLDSYYQGRIFFSDPERFSNVLNSVGARLQYRISSRLSTGVAYRLTISDFTQQSRHETYQRVTGRLRYAITPSVRVSLFGGLGYGRSSEARINYDDTFFGISLDANISIF